MSFEPKPTALPRGSSLITHRSASAQMKMLLPVFPPRWLPILRLAVWTADRTKRDRWHTLGPTLCLALLRNCSTKSFRRPTKTRNSFSKATKRSSSTSSFVGGPFLAGEESSSLLSRRLRRFQKSWGISWGGLAMGRISTRDKPRGTRHFSGWLINGLREDPLLQTWPRAKLWALPREFSN